VTREEYIPSARDAVVGYFGRNSSGNLRSLCVRCNDATPLTDTSRIYGDLYVSGGPDRSCDTCSVTFLSLSEQCQRDHDDQQSRWAKLPITHVVEMGMIGAVRCRIY
jgi:hypothetical protein